MLPRRSRISLAVLALPLWLAACGENPADPDAAAMKQAAVDAAVQPEGAQLRRKAIDAATASRARWSAAGNLPLTPVSMANLPDGKVLMWSAEERFQFGSGNGRTYSAIFDPNRPEVVPERLVTETGHDMFCPGTSYLADGRLLINGGIDAANTSLYDPSTATWTRGAAMNIPRGYNASTPLGDGSVLTLGGSWSGGAGNKHGEVWTAAGGWRRLSGVPVGPFLQSGGLWGSDSHMWLIPTGNGKVLHAGPQASMSWIDPTGNGAVIPVGPRGDDTDAVTGISVMYDAGRILKAGGMSGINGDNTASTAAYVIEANGPVTTRKVGAMKYARTFHNSVVLPNGQVVIVGGQTRGVGFSNDFAVLPAEIFDPISETFTALPAMTKPRNYHSIALLMPDGRVLSAGGGLCGNGCVANQPNFELLSPPYLFNPDGSGAIRPRITGAPAVVGHGTRVRVTADPTVTAFALVRLSSTTHTVNNDQRRLPVSFTSPSPGTFDLDIPSNPGVLLAGHWMLFAMNGQGTPSIAHTLRVSLDGTPVLANPGDQGGTVGAFARIAVRGTDPAGRALTWSAQGLPPGTSIDGSGTISGTPTVPGRYVVTVSAANGQRTASTWFQWTVAGSGAVRYLRLEALSEVNGNPWTSIAELNLIDAAGQTIARGGWNASADAAEVDTPATAAIDGNPATIWHTPWRAANPTPPHWLQLDLGVAQNVAGLRILPRQDGSQNGSIARFRVWASSDGTNWGVPLVEGDLSELGAANVEKTVWLYTLSARKPTSQSSTDFGGDAARATDGNRDGLWGSGSVTHSLTETQPWWQVDLGASQTIRAIRAWNRTDCCGERLNGFTVFVSETEMTGRTRAQLLADPAIWRWTHTGAAARLTEVPASTRGRYVRVVLPNAGSILSLAELEVFGFAGTNRAPNWGPMPSPVLVRGVPATITIAATDPDGDRLSFTATGLPPGLSIDPATGVLSGTPSAAGDFSTMVIATDARGVSASATIAIGVDEPPIVVQPVTTSPATAGTAVRWTANATGTGLTYRWDYGDGTAATGFLASNTTTHVYANAGLYTVTLTVRDATGATSTQTFRQQVNVSGTPRMPSASSNLVLEPRVAGARLWTANPDNGTVTVIDAAMRTRVAEITVGAAPRSVAVAPDGRVWVANRDSASLSVINPVSLQVVATHAMPRGSQPYGIAFAPDGSAWVALEASGALLRVDTGGIVRATIDVGPNPRHVAVTADGARVLVSRFVTRPLAGESTVSVDTSTGGGEVVVVTAATGAIARTVVLAHSDRTDTNVSGRGVPNYLGAAAIAPDGRSAWIPSKQDNVRRGAARDGLPLDFQNTVRAISSMVDLVALAEVPAARVDHDNASVASAAIYHPSGRFVFAALETSRQVAVIDVAGRRELMRFEAGLAPQGLAVSGDGLQLYVHNFMDRSVGAYDLSRLVNTGTTQVPLLGTVRTVGTERLAANVLLGKQLFYDARDPRLSRDSYMSCASCHNDGGHDGRTWDLTGFGEGLRNTSSLRGRAGAQGRLHWSANFDEVQDFEGQIRTFAGGTGLMTNAQFNTGTRSQPLGNRKTGVSADLDALAAYVSSLTAVAPSPLRAPDGAFTANAVAGAALYTKLGCVDCHGGRDFTASGTIGPVDIGTIRQPGSGQRLGGNLLGIDPPTLRDVWATAPYLHDGRAATLPQAIRAHRGLVATDAEVTQLARYVAEIGDAAAPPAEAQGLLGEYFAGTMPGVGAPLVTRNEAVDFDWGAGAPAGATADRFSVRWSGAVIADVAGSYQFQTVSDDGVRLWVDGKLVIDNWTEHPPVTDTAAAVVFEAGRRYAIRLEYFENGGGAVMRLRWRKPNTTDFVAIPAGALRAAVPTVPIGGTAGLRGEYFAGRAPGVGPVLLTRTEAVDFDWGGGSPGGAVPTDEFSARWTGTVRAESTGAYRFRTVSDDGVRLWVGGQALINNWTLHAPTTDDSGAINLVAGQRYPISLEFYEAGGGAVIKLYWLRPGQSSWEPVPGYVLQPPTP